MSGGSTADGGVGGGANDLPDRLEGNRFGRVVVARWKHAVVAVVVGLTAWALYRIGGGWTLDATVFAIAAAVVVAYSLLTLRSDIE
ncbi:hypothetical protein ACFQPA_02805 [Halomarina halobia]|uniref:Preprotein translocase subunit SecE n=1 Tax=Halomarina halobia TaxID=3033386 RepID=A0ABD6A4X3_9EURY|nr:hypothetical protein [Halomarina sp. PSR21]